MNFTNIGLQEDIRALLRLKRFTEMSNLINIKWQYMVRKSYEEDGKLLGDPLLESISRVMSLNVNLLKNYRDIRNIIIHPNKMDSDFIAFNRFDRRSCKKLFIAIDNAILSVYR